MLFHFKDKQGIVPLCKWEKLMNEGNNTCHPLTKTNDAVNVDASKQTWSPKSTNKVSHLKWINKERSH